VLIFYAHILMWLSNQISFRSCTKV